MKVSLNWLREYVALPDDVPALCDLLTLAGVEVEQIEIRGITNDKVVVAQILASEPHPNADRLSVCKVDDGSGTSRQIVCGAKNYKAGDKVPLALPGAVLPGGFAIKSGKLRGVESQGMMCSAKELNLAEDAEGLMILPPEAAIGDRLQTLFPADTILEVEVTPNRPDLLSHIGMAREIAALARQKLRVMPAEPVAGEAAGSVEILLDAGDDCPFYTARKISGVTVGPSPGWLKQKLEAVGLRPINNVVDITNFVMLEMGQPLHAFDAASLSGGICVRHAAEGEDFHALDGRSYRLKPSQMVIADFEKAVAIAGFMGGERSGVTPATRDVILESAYFRPGGIRRTSRELGLASDSSYRFERGVDPAGVNVGSLRAARLIAQLAGGVIESYAAAGEEPGLVKARAEGLDCGFVHQVPLRRGKCSEVAGGKVPESEVEVILFRLGLAKKGDAWQVPSYRPDLVREIDLVEEVIRVFGIENIPPRMQGHYAAGTTADVIHDRSMRLRQDLAAIGFYEARSISMISARAVADDPLTTGDMHLVKNPLSEDQAMLRPNLLPGLLHVLAQNFRAGMKNVRLFEIGRVFRASAPEERLHLALVMSGSARPASWRGGSGRALDFFDLKGVTASLGLGEITFAPVEKARLPLAAEILAGGLAIGIAGQLAPARVREMDASSAVLVAEINLSGLPLAERGERTFREIARFPMVTRDIALLVPLRVTHSQIEETLISACEPLLERVELFDVFTDPSGVRIPADRKSLAYSLTYRANERTLTSEEVNAAHARLKEWLKAAVDAQFRE